MDRFLKLLSSNLTLQTLMIINKKIVASCPHFRNLQEADICMIIQNLQLQLYLSEEKIIFQGEKGTHVRFIINGNA